MTNKKFISIIRGYHQQLFDFDYKEHYHMMPFNIMLEKGYTCELFAIDTRVRIEDDPLYDSRINIIYYTGLISYVQYLRKNRHAVVYSNSLTIKTLLVGLICRKSIFYSHTNPIGKSKMRWLKKRVILFFYQFFTHIRVNNKEEEKLINKYTKNKAVRIPLSISDTFYTPNLSNRPLALSRLGNIYPIKQPEQLLVVMKSLIKKFPGIHLHIIGEDRYAQFTGKAFVDYIKKAGLEDHITIHGYIPHHQLKDVLSQTQIFINTSSDEGMCLAVYEGVLAGNALCLPNILAFPGAFGDNALYHQNTEELVDNITYYVEHPEKMHQHTTDNQTMIFNELSYETIKEKLKNVFLQLAKTHT